MRTVDSKALVQGNLEMCKQLLALEARDRFVDIVHDGFEEYVRSIQDIVMQLAIQNDAEKWKKLDEEKRSLAKDLKAIAKSMRRYCAFRYTKEKNPLREVLMYHKKNSVFLREVFSVFKTIPINYRNEFFDDMEEKTSLRMCFSKLERLELVSNSLENDGGLFALRYSQLCAYRDILKGMLKSLGR